MHQPSRLHAPPSVTPQFRAPVCWFIFRCLGFTFVRRFWPLYHTILDLDLPSLLTRGNFPSRLTIHTNFLLPESLYIFCVCTHELIGSALLPRNGIKGRAMSCTAQLYESPSLRFHTHSTRFQVVLLPPVLTTPCLLPPAHRLCPPCLLLLTRRPASSMYRLLRRSSSPTSSSSQTSSLIVPSLLHSTMTETPSRPTLSTGYFPVLLILPRERWPLCAACKAVHSLRTATMTVHQTASASYAIS
jgi:hypothetical protein